MKRTVMAVCLAAFLGGMTGGLRAETMEGTSNAPAVEKPAAKKHHKKKHHKKAKGGAKKKAVGQQS